MEEDSSQSHSQTEGEELTVEEVTNMPIKFVEATATKVVAQFEATKAGVETDEEEVSPKAKVELHSTILGLLAYSSK